MSYIDSSARRKFAARDEGSSAKRTNEAQEIRPYVPRKRRNTDSIPTEDSANIPPPPPPPSKGGVFGIEDESDEGFIPPPPPEEEEEEETETSKQAEGTQKLTAAERIRLKLAGKPIPEELGSSPAIIVDKQQKTRKESYRDPKILAKLAQPVFVSSTIGQGISKDEAKSALEQHKKKLMKWKYHMAVRASEVQKSKKESAIAHQNARGHAKK